MPADPQDWPSAIAALSDDDGCEVAPTASVTERTDNENVSVGATVAFRYSCDDSGAGGLYDVLVVNRDGGWDFQPGHTWLRSLCSRGPADREACL